VAPADNLEPLRIALLDPEPLVDEIVAYAVEYPTQGSCRLGRSVGRGLGRRPLTRRRSGRSRGPARSCAGKAVR
jgi:hypothetical protein